MKLNWKEKGYDVGSVIEAICSRKDPFDLHFGIYYPVLVSAAQWRADVPESERLRIVRASLPPKASSKQSTPEKILKQLDQLQTDYLKKPQLEYVLATSLSLGNKLRIGKRVARDCEIRFTVRQPRSYRQHIEAPEAQWHGVAKDPSEFKKVNVRTRARTPEAARLRIFESLDLIRGIWNYGLARNRRRITFGGLNRKPLNAILLGPRFAVYEGDSVEPVERGYCTSFHHVHSVGPTQKWEVMKATEAWIRRVLLKINYSEELELALIRFCRALDEHDLDAGLLKLWTVLELLSGRCGDRYDTLVRRVSALWNGREPHKSVLQHLRDQRNQIAHAGEGSEFSEAQVDQLKFYAEQLFSYHFSQGHRFENLEEAAQFLELPPNPRTLKRQIALRKAALAIRNDAGEG